MRRRGLACALAVGLAPAAPAVAQSTVTYTLTPSADTDVRERSASSVCGACTTLQVKDHANGTDRAAFRFDLTAIPTGSRLVSANLRVYAIEPLNSLVSVRRITTVWSEATANWTNTSGLSPEASAQATFTPGTADRYYSVALTTLVDRWLLGATANNGVLLSSASSGNAPAKFTSKEWATASQRPELVVVVQPPPSLVSLRTSTVISDPDRGAMTPKRIPGATIGHVLAVENRSAGYPDANAVAVTEPVPSGAALYVGDLGDAGSGPLAFTQGVPSSTLTYAYGGLTSVTDDVEFSSDSGVSWAYVPTPDASGYDAAVTHVRINPKGTFAGAAGTAYPSFTVTYRAKLR